ncbi:AraC family transcriptional regulator [Nocardiopsis suaedae]|uniref:AraC family transcriptional regulator n=1 Tax=Nocardiopsis suaedae TaxID=3018444 RepID=A0ABT4TN85_9ACTN|nr:AraC family transcriptional regulator [Nocardiopsis suaedae]MDA2806086.1 AraC family transcriptional regulator [Nocardiopsis suaedae]
MESRRTSLIEAELRKRVIAAFDRPEEHAAIDDVALHVARGPVAPMLTHFHPTLYVVLQGAKRLILGGRQIDYHGGQLVLMGVDLPALVEIIQATEPAPYIAVELAVDRRVLGELVAQMPPRPPGRGRPVGVYPLPASAVSATSRLVQLMESPTDARILAEGVKREILYRVLSSGGGDGLLQMVRAEETLASIGQATDWMHDHLGAPIAVEDLAARARMSMSTFYRAFKDATGTTPTQYHKMLRLHEARRLVALRSRSMTSISEAVGYASPAQFSRDYKRAFGSAPIHDAQRYGREAVSSGESAAADQ